MLAQNKYYIVGDKKTFENRKVFAKEINAVYDRPAKAEEIEKIWLRYSPIIETDYGKGGYAETKPHKRGSFEAWSYQYN